MAVCCTYRVCSVTWYPALIGVLELILNGRFTARPSGSAAAHNGDGCALISREHG